MKILYFFENKPTLMDQWQTYHFISELKSCGVEIVVFSPLTFESFSEANLALLDFLKENKVDLFMTPYNEDKIFISTLIAIDELNIAKLLICFDNLVIPFEHKKVCSYFDLVWLTSKETEYLFQQWGANTIFLPYAANPSLFKPLKMSEINRVCFIGTPYGSRVNTLNTLVEKNIQLDLYSNFLKNKNLPSIKSNPSILDYLGPLFNLMRFSYGRRIIKGALKQKFLRTSNLAVDNKNITFKSPVPLSELGAVYSSYSLSLSSTAARNTGVLKKPLNIINLRSFEIPMAGGLQICPYTDELASYFKEDEEILFYRSSDELIEKSIYYLAEENFELRQKIKNAARLRAEKDHSWITRFECVFNRLEINFTRETFNG